METAVSATSDNRARALLEGLNPSAKLLSALLLGLAAVAWPSPLMGAVLVVALLAWAFAAGMGRGLAKVVLGFGLPLTLMLLLIQGCYSPDNTVTLLDLGFAQLGLEGTVYALKTVVTLLTFLSGLYLVEKTTYTGELVADLQERGLSPRAGYLVLASLNVVPQMRRRMAAIQEAQACRGLQTDGGVVSRLRATIPLLGPVVMSSLADAEQRSMTLETRGFRLEGTPHTSYVVVRHSSHDRMVTILSGLAVAASVAACLASLFL